MQESNLKNKKKSEEIGKYIFNFTLLSKSCVANNSITRYVNWDDVIQWLTFIVVKCLIGLIIIDPQSPSINVTLNSKNQTDEGKLSETSLLVHLNMKGSS